MTQNTNPISRNLGYSLQNRHSIVDRLEVCLRLGAGRKHYGVIRESALMHKLERADLSYGKRKAVADIILHAKTSGKRKKKHRPTADSSVVYKHRDRCEGAFIVTWKWDYREGGSLLLTS